MKPARSSGPSIRALREQKERAARQAFVEATRTCEDAALQLQTASDELAAGWNSFCSDLSTDVTPARLLQTRSRCNLLELRQRERATALQNARRAMDAAMREMMLAARDRAALDLHPETLRRVPGRQTVRVTTDNFCTFWFLAALFAAFTASAEPAGAISANAPLPGVGVSLACMGLALALVAAIVPDCIWIFRNWHRLTLRDEPAAKFNGVGFDSSTGRYAFYVIAWYAQWPSTFTTAWRAAHQRALEEIELLKLLTAPLQKQYVKDKGELELRVSQPWTPCSIPDEPLTVKILDLQTTGNTPAFTVRFELHAGEESIGTYQVAAKARIWRDVWVVQSDVKAGDLVADAHIAKERRDLLALREPPAEFAAGDTTLEFAEPLQSGSPMLARSVQGRSVFHRGQAPNAPLRSRTSGVAMEGAALDEGAPARIARDQNAAMQRDSGGKVLNE